MNAGLIQSDADIGQAESIGLSEIRDDSVVKGGDGIQHRAPLAHYRSNGMILDLRKSLAQPVGDLAGSGIVKLEPDPTPIEVIGDPLH